MAKDKKKKKKGKKGKALTPEQMILAALGMDPRSTVTIVEVDEREAAANTVAVLSAAQGIFSAHDADLDCTPFHSALTDMIKPCVTNPVMAAMVIKHLATIGAGYLTPEELQSMAMELAADYDD